MRGKITSKIKQMSEPAAMRYAREIVSSKLEDAWIAESENNPRERVLFVLSSRIKNETNAVL